MSIKEFNDYWEAVTIIEAQEVLIAMNVAVYPYMKKADAQKFHRKISRMAYPKNEERATRPLTPSELAQLWGAGVIKNGR